MENLLTVEDVSRIMRVLPQQVRRWASTGRIQGVQFGRRWRFRPDAIDQVSREGLQAVSGKTYFKTTKTLMPESGRSWRTEPA